MGMPADTCQAGNAWQTGSVCFAYLTLHPLPLLAVQAEPQQLIPGSNSLGCPAATIRRGQVRYRPQRTIVPEECQQGGAVRPTITCII